MAEPNRALLKKKIAYYTNLLKKYEYHENAKLQSQTKHTISRNFCWKQPSISAHNVAKSSTYSLSLQNQPYSFNKLHSPKLKSGTNYQHNFKAKYTSVIENHTAKSTKFPTEFNKIFCNKYKMTVLNNNKSLPALPSASENVSSSVSQDLMKEITDVTNKLKIKSKVLVSNTKDSTNLESLSKSNKSYKFTNALNNYKTTDKDNLFSKNNIKYVHKVLPNSHTSSPNLSKVAHRKLNNNKVNLNSNCFHLISSKKSLNSVHLSKYSYKNDKQALKFKTNNSPLKKIIPMDQAANTEKNYTAVSKLSESNVPKTNIFLSNNSSSVQSKITEIGSQGSKKKVDITNESSENKVVKNEFVASKIKSPVVSRIKSKSDIYSKVNKSNSLKLNKSPLKIGNIHHKSPLNTKKVKQKLNMKYKVINKTNCLNRKIGSVKYSSKSKEISPLSFDKSDPLYMLLRESNTIDKLEQELLAKSSSLANSLKPDSRGNQINKFQSTLNGFTPKSCLKKTSLKRSKVVASKYKVINKTLKTPSNYFMKRKSCVLLRNPAKKLSNKMICSKFSIVNKQSYPIYMSPVIKGKSILVKRLYKSKNTIINKNSSPSNLSAKIKSKYLALSKRKLSKWPKPISYMKIPVKSPNFKGSFGRNRLHIKHLKYQKTKFFNQKVARKSANFRVNNRIFNTYNKNIWLKRKSFGGQVEKSKIQKRISIGGRTYIKAGHMLKVVSPSSTNLASRALHRRINRAVTASNKKSLKKTVYCMFYNRFGRCNRGVKCTYIHDPSKIAVCTRFLRGTCKIDGCPFSHEPSPGKMAICTFFLLGSCTKENCPYRHEKLSPDAELCKAFVQGYCPSGKECNKAHILICPKFIQGECEKGSSCAYPHPPPKAKKNVQKEAMGEKDDELDDAWLEKVARYFQPSEEHPLNCKSASLENEMSQVLPKRARIEEQPSYIPLCDISAAFKMEKSCQVEKKQNGGGINII